LAVVACGASAGLAFSVPQGHSAIVGISYGVVMSGTLGAIELFIFSGPMRDWLSRFSFTAAFAMRSAIYAAVIALLQWLQPGEFVAGLPPESSGGSFWSGFIYSAAVSVLFNFGFAITNLIGARSLLNFLTGRYHAPVEESRFVLFVDIAGSTGLAESLGGLAIHRLLDRTFRLLTLSVVDYRAKCSIMLATK
jgi:adenylate cyclase